ncbi:MAG: DUF1616 domain-containing protein [Patescibacteria group bacterium]
MAKKIIFYLFFSTLSIALIIAILSVWVPFITSIRIIFSFLYLLVLPGLVLSYVFWKHGEIDPIERITLSIGLSLGSIPLVVYVLNKIGVPINFINVFFEILGVIIISIILLFINKNFKKKLPYD